MASRGIFCHVWLQMLDSIKIENYDIIKFCILFYWTTIISELYFCHTCAWHLYWQLKFNKHFGNRNVSYTFFNILPTHLFSWFKGRSQTLVLGIYYNSRTLFNKLKLDPLGLPIHPLLLGAYFLRNSLDNRMSLGIFTQ